MFLWKFLKIFLWNSEKLYEKFEKIVKKIINSEKIM